MRNRRWRDKATYLPKVTGSQHRGVLCLHSPPAPPAPIVSPGGKHRQTGRPVAWREDGATGPSSFRPVSTPGPLQSISVNMTACLLRAKHCIRNNEHWGAAGCFIRSVHVLVLILIIFQKFKASMQRRFQVQKGRHWRT